MVLAIVLGVLGVVSVAAFVLPMRLTRDRPQRPARRTGTPAASGVDRLEVGAELTYDAQRWDVRGTQHVMPADGPAWTAWHLDDRGQSGWLATVPGRGDVLFAVRAERPQTLDGERPLLHWRDHEWTRAELATSPVRAAGERRVPRGPLVPVPDGTVERAVFVRDGLPSRRLVLERTAGEATWNAWIGGLVPAAMVDVWPTDAGDGGAARETPGPQPS
jgi:hypothetical protein